MCTVADFLHLFHLQTNSQAQVSSRLTIGVIPRNLSNEKAKCCDKTALISPGTSAITYLAWILAGSGCAVPGTSSSPQAAGEGAPSVSGIQGMGAPALDVAASTGSGGPQALGSGNEADAGQAP